MMQDVSADARFSNIGDLPSGQKPYDFKQLFCRPLSVKELKLISQAASMDDVNYLIRAVDLVIDQDVSNLTVGDFFYVLMWLRIKSFPKTPLAVNWKCRAKYFVEVKEDGSNGPVFPKSDATQEMLELKMIKELQCSSQNTDLVRLSTMDILCIPDDFAGLDKDLDYPRVKLLPELIEFGKDKDMAFLVPVAQWLKAGKTLKDKIDILEKEPNLELYERLVDINDTIVHGVKETIKLVCPVCNTEYSHALEISPTTFFRR
jgi:hypothetical protein